MTADWANVPGDVAELDVLREDELIELGEHRRRDVAGHRQQDHIAELVDEQIRDHPALRREIGGVASPAGLERDDVVREQALQIGRAILPGHDDAAAIRAIDQAGASSRCLVRRLGNRGDHVIKSIDQLSLDAFPPLYPRRRCSFCRPGRGRAQPSAAQQPAARRPDDW